MFRIRMVEQPMPTGSRDPDVLLAWLLDSMGLVRSRSEGATIDEEQGAIHRIVRHTLLEEPLRGWDNAAISEFSGLSQTGVHNQMHKLREVGLVSSQLSGRWHVNVLRGGSMAGAVELVAVQTQAIARMRLAELSGLISESEQRMSEVSEDDSQDFRIDIAEPGPSAEGSDRLDALIIDLGIIGDRVKSGDTVARRVFENWRPATARLHCKHWLTVLKKLVRERSELLRDCVKRVSSIGWLCATVSPWMSMRAS